MNAEEIEFMFKAYTHEHEHGHLISPMNLERFVEDLLEQQNQSQPKQSHKEVALTAIALMLDNDAKEILEVLQERFPQPKQLSEESLKDLAFEYAQKNRTEGRYSQAAQYDFMQGFKACQARTGGGVDPLDFARYILTHYNTDRMDESYAQPVLTDYLTQRNQQEKGCI